MKKPHIAEVPGDVPPGEAHRSKFEVTLDRLASMSPKDLQELGRRLCEHETGEYILKLVLAGYQQPRQPTLPGVDS